MSDNKTLATDADVATFLAGVEPERRRTDALALKALFDRVTGLPAVMWGASIIGYGQYHYRYESGREGDFMLTGFSPRKANLTLYVMPGFADYADKLAKLGKHKLGRSCLYVNKLADVDLDVLADIIRTGVADMRAKYDA